MTPISKVDRLKVSALGPLTDILKDESVTELVVSGHEDILVRRERVNSYEARPFDATRLKSLARKLAQSIRQPLGSERTQAEGYLSEGFRIAVFAGDGVEPGPMIVVRRVPHLKTDLQEMVANGQLALRALELLHHCIKIRSNVLIVGPNQTVRRKLVAGLAGLWAENNRVLAVDHPFYTDTPAANIVFLDGDDALDSVSRFIGEVIVVDEPRAEDWAPLLLKEQSFLGAIEATSMSQAIRGLLSRVTYARPGMVMTGVEALLTSNIELIVLCDDEKITGLGELQHWGSQLAVRALGKWKEDEFLLDLRESALRDRLKEAAPGLSIEGVELGDDADSVEVGSHLGIKPVVTAAEKRRVSSAFISDNADRFSEPEVVEPEAELAEPDDVNEQRNSGKTQIPVEAAALDEDESSSTRIEMASEELDLPQLDEPLPVQDMSEDDLELGTDHAELDEVAEEPYVDDMPSVAYSLELGDEDDNSLDGLPDPEQIDSPFDEPTPALLLDDEGGPFPERFGKTAQPESQATMIISQEDVDAEIFAPSGDDVQAGTGRPSTRSLRAKSAARRRKS